MNLLTEQLIWLWIAQVQDPHKGVQRWHESQSTCDSGIRLIQPWQIHSPHGQTARLPRRHARELFRLA